MKTSRPGQFVSRHPTFRQEFEFSPKKKYHLWLLMHQVIVLIKDVSHQASQGALYLSGICQVKCDVGSFLVRCLEGNDLVNETSQNCIVDMLCFAHNYQHFPVMPIQPFKKPDQVNIHDLFEEPIAGKKALLFSYIYIYISICIFPALHKSSQMAGIGQEMKPSKSELLQKKDTAGLTAK